MICLGLTPVKVVIIIMLVIVNVIVVSIFVVIAVVFFAKMRITVAMVNISLIVCSDQLLC